MRIASWSHNYLPHPGGLEVIVAELNREFATVGHAVTLVTSAWGGAQGVNEERGVRIHRLPSLHFLENFDVPYPLPIGSGIGPALRETAAADLHHAHGSLYLSTLLAARQAKRLGRAFVVTEHVGFVRYASSLLNVVQRLAWAVVGRRILGLADRVITYNGRVREWLASRFRREVLFVPNGVNLSRFSPAGTAEKAALREKLDLERHGAIGLFVGRAAAKKNLDVLLRVPREGFTLVCCGSRDRALPPDVRDLGLVPHEGMVDVYRTADFLIHLGVGEGLPVALQEAAACGLPLLLLWDPGYDVELSDAAFTIRETAELSGALGKLLASDALLRELSARSRAWAERSGAWSRTAARYLDLFRETLRSPREGSPPREA